MCRLRLSGAARSKQTADKYVIIPPTPPPQAPKKAIFKNAAHKGPLAQNKRPTSASLSPPPPHPPNTQESNLPKCSRYERRNARSVPAPGKSRLAITVTITACRVKSKNVANVSYLPRFLASPNLSRRGPDPAGSGKHCKIVPVNEPACRVLGFCDF